MATEEELWERWCRDFDEAQVDVYTLLHTRWMWRAITSLLANGNPTSYATVTNYLTRTYVATVCTGVRREADSMSSTSSLARCIDILLDKPRIASRERFAALAVAHGAETGAEITEAMISSAFAEFSPGGSDHVERALLRRWRDELTADVQPVKRYTDKILAHRERSGGSIVELTPSWEAINGALDSVGRTFKRLFGLRHPTQLLGSATPIPSLEFVRMFQHPWHSQEWSPPSFSETF